MKYVIICNEVFRWEEKAPFVRSGKSVHGALEWNKDTDTVRCHDCGGWFHALGTHVAAKHGTAQDYKKRHGLRQKTALMSFAKRSALSEKQKRRKPCNPVWLNGKRGLNRQATLSGVAEYRNKMSVCQAQLLAAIRSKAVGASAPTISLFPDRFKKAARLYYGGWNNACRAAGLMANHNFSSDKGILLETLRDFYVLNRRLPVEPDFRNSSRLCAMNTYVAAFGSVGNALDAAGLAAVSQ